MIEILIVSKADFELTTNEVCDWLNHYDIPYIRLNVDRITDAKYYEILIDFEQNSIFIFDKINTKYVDLTNIKIVWCRRFIDEIFNKIIASESCLDYNIVQFAKFQSAEQNQFLKILYEFYPNWLWIDNYKDTNVNKLKVLKIAKKNNLEIPITYIANSKTQLSHILKKSNKLITKPLYEGIGFFTTDGAYVTHTQKVRESKHHQFLPSLFQEEIEKEYEIRIFYIDETLYSMAIFSSKNQKTKTDFRNYDLLNPNRYIPYVLPKNVAKKLVNLMKDINLSTGSIDMIKDSFGRYIFLEVNPIGQFGMVSKPCNYNLEKLVAQVLIKKLEHAKKNI